MEVPSASATCDRTRIVGLFCPRSTADNMPALTPLMDARSLNDHPSSTRRCLIDPPSTSEGADADAIAALLFPFRRAICLEN